MKIPKEITKEIIDEMIPIWEELAEKGWDNVNNYSGLCEHFEKMGCDWDDIFVFMDDNFLGKDDIFIKPFLGKKGAQKRVEILKQIREQL